MSEIPEIFIAELCQNAEVRGSRRVRFWTYLKQIDSCSTYTYIRSVTGSTSFVSDKIITLSLLQSLAETKAVPDLENPLKTDDSFSCDV